jgi:hypothetical protein
MLAGKGWQSFVIAIILRPAMRRKPASPATRVWLKEFWNQQQAQLPSQVTRARHPCQAIAYMLTSYLSDNKEQVKFNRPLDIFPLLAT